VIPAAQILSLLNFECIFRLLSPHKYHKRGKQTFNPNIADVPYHTWSFYFNLFPCPKMFSNSWYVPPTKLFVFPYQTHPTPVCLTIDLFYDGMYVPFPVTSPVNDYCFFFLFLSFQAFWCFCHPTLTLSGLLLDSNSLLSGLRFTCIFWSSSLCLSPSEIFFHLLDCTMALEQSLFIFFIAAFFSNAGFWSIPACFFVCASLLWETPKRRRSFFLNS